ncbi:MAG: DUF2062 domain-containing protein [Moorea sp. SIO2B7]|nr:DUF2062 domain-containing protein [Moorena sp. SIO2B7]
MVLEKPPSPSLKSRRTKPKPWWLRRWRYFYKSLLRLRGKPKAIARGFSIGVFAGCFPLLGLQIMIGVLLAALLRGNKLASVAGTWISNPITYVPIFVFNFKVGKLLLGSRDLSVAAIDFQSLSELMELGYTIIATLLLGCFVVGSVLAFCTYFLSLRLIIRWHHHSRYHKSHC